MSEHERAVRAFSGLVRIARRRAEDLSRQIAALEAAHADAQSAIARLDLKAREEEALAKASPDLPVSQLAAFLAGVAGKRRALEATREKLAIEIESARSALQDAHVETRKLEHLIELQDRERQAAGQKRENEALDAAAQARHRRSRFH